MTPTQSDLVDQLVTVLSRDDRIGAIWLYGSLGRGTGDAWSDVDLVAVVEPADRAACLADYSQSDSGLPDRVLTLSLYGAILACTTADWARFDISFLSAAEMAGLHPAALKHLRGDASLPPPRTPKATDTAAAQRLLGLANEFLRVLGLASVGIGRGEWLASQQGCSLLRQMLVDLMVEENGISPADRGGAKRLNPHLTPEQRRLLEALTPPAADRPALLAANVQLACIFLPRAKSLATRLGVTWPDAFEQATRRHLKATLGLDL